MNYTMDDVKDLAAAEEAAWLETKAEYDRKTAEIANLLDKFESLVDAISDRKPSPEAAEQKAGIQKAREQNNDTTAIDGSYKQHCILVDALNVLLREMGYDRLAEAAEEQIRFEHEQEMLAEMKREDVRDDDDHGLEPEA